MSPEAERMGAHKVLRHLNGPVCFRGEGSERHMPKAYRVTDVRHLVHGGLTRLRHRPN